MRTGIAWGLASTLVLVVTFGIVFLRPAQASSQWGADYFPNITLITQDGKPVKFYDDLLKGKIVAIDLIYTQCKDSCPLETARLRQVQRMLGDRVGKDIFFYSISIDPQHDTPAVLHDYAEMYNAGPGWLFLTGNKDEIALLGKKLGLYNGPTKSRDGHIPALLIGNEATGQWMRNSATDNPRFLAIMLGQFMDSYRNTQAAQHSSQDTAQHPPQDTTQHPHDTAQHSAHDTAQYLSQDSAQQPAQRPAQHTDNNYANAQRLVIDDPGQYIFASHCAACHTIGHRDAIEHSDAISHSDAVEHGDAIGHDGERHGESIGPDLAGVTTRRDPAWLARFIADPDKLIEEHDPIATDLFQRYKQVRMPNLRLADVDVEALIAFLQKQDQKQKQDQQDRPAPAAYPGETR